MSKLTVAIHKLTSCSGCQLAFINQGEGLLALLHHVDIVHFIEGGIYAPDRVCDLAFVEGSVSSPDDLERLKSIRENSKQLVTIGACATSGGVQALRNMLCDSDNRVEFVRQVYARPEFVQSLGKSSPVAEFVKVDDELWGCPVSVPQLLEYISQLLLGARPRDDKEKLCMACKRQGNVCTLVTGHDACMGPVTRTGCGALCPAYGKACYSCYGPSEQPNSAGLARRLEGIGYLPAEVAARFAQIHSNAPEFRSEIEPRIRVLSGAQAGAKADAQEKQG
jgi:coenzyme F420-reducing hydrogenase gamma subunit